MSEPRFNLVEGGNLVITYLVRMDAEWLRDYEAWMTVVYTYVGTGWALVLRSHTPTADFLF